MNERKPGERVAVYQFGERYTGIVEKVAVNSAAEVEKIFFVADGTTSGMWVHRKQTRRLTSKPLRSIWVEENQFGELVSWWRDDEARPFHAVEFREAKRGKKK